MAVFTARNVPFTNEFSVLHEVEHGLDELALLAHRRRKLAANSLDGSTKNSAVIKFQLIEPVASKLMGLRLQYLCVLKNLGLQLSVLLARNDAHAAALARS